MLANVSETSLITAFLAGLVSFISPCVLPLVPSYLMYVSGVSFQQLAHSGEHAGVRKSVVINALLFIAGFSIVFIGFGASASVLGQVLLDYQDALRKVGAVVLIVFGLQLSGLFTFKFLMMEKRVSVASHAAGPIASLLIGGTFAAGWTPCVGPILGTMLLYAATKETMLDGMTLLAFYSFGFGLPLLMASMALNRVLSFFQRMKRYLGLVSGMSGAVLMMMGVLMYHDRVSLLTAFFERHGIGTYFGMEGR